MAQRTMQYQDVISALYPETKNKIATHNITFQITDACNLRCTYCYQINKSTHVMSIDVAKRFIDLLLDDNADTAEYIDSKNSKAVIIEFIGGEPLLQIDLMDEIMDYFVEQMIIKDHPWQYHYMISVCSNGLLYFDPKWQAFMKKHWNHLSFNISIDGNKKLHDACRVRPDGSGSYDAAMAGVRHFVDVLGGKMGSKMTLAPANIMYTAEAVKGLIESGYKEINLNCVFEKGWTEEHATILYYQLKELADYLIDNNLDDIYISIFEQSMFHPKRRDDTENWCGGNGRMISVDWKGDIYPCIRYMESSLGTDAPPLIVGNVYDGITALPEHKECAKCLKAVNRITQSTEECINCAIADGCAWCQALNYQDSGGDINHRATYICIMHQARALGNAYYWNKLFRKNNEPKRMKIWLEKEKALKIIPQEELDMLKELEWPVGVDS